jgi:hypothetical protein
MIAIIEYTGNETDEECKAIAWAIFCNAHPHEAYANDPEAFWDHFHKLSPNITREKMIALLKETLE